VLFGVDLTPPGFNGQRVDSAELVIVDTNGIGHSAGRFEWGEFFYEFDQDPFLTVSVPYRWSTSLAPTTDGGFWVAEYGPGTLYRVSADGAKRNLVELPIVREKPIDADREKYSEEKVSFLSKVWGEKGRLRMTALIKKIKFPTLLPGFSGGAIAPSSDGGVWV